MSSTFEQVRQLASDVLAVPVEEIDTETSADTVESWDSIQHFTLVLEERFQVQFSPEEMEEMRNIQKICEVVEFKLSKQVG